MDADIKQLEISKAFIDLREIIKSVAVIHDWSFDVLIKNVNRDEENALILVVKINEKIIVRSEYFLGEKHPDLEDIVGDLCDRAIMELIKVGIGTLASREYSITQSGIMKISKDSTDEFLTENAYGL